MSEYNICELRQKIDKLSEQFLEEYTRGNNPEKLLIMALKLVSKMSLKMGMYESAIHKVDKNLFEEIEHLKWEKLDNIAQECLAEGAVNILRYVLAIKLKENYGIQKIKNAEDLDNQILEIKKNFNNRNIKYFEPYFLPFNPDILIYIQKYDRENSFKSWKVPYRIMLPFLYDTNLKTTIWRALEVIRDNLLKDLNLEKTWECKNQQGWSNQVRSYYGFEGPSNFGSQRAAIMLHPKEIPDHKNSFQISLYFINGIIKYGKDIGIELKSKVKDFIPEINEIIINSDEDKEILAYFKKITDNLNNIKADIIKRNDALIKKDKNITKVYTAESDALYSNGEEINLFSDDVEENSDDSNNGGNNKPPTKNNTGDFNNQDDNNDNDNTFSRIKTVQVGNTIIHNKIMPNIDENEEYLDREKIVDYLVNEIISEPSVQALNIGIYANWGDGKSHIINMIKNKLQDINKQKDASKKKTIIIDYDAWLYNDQEHIWASLAMSFFDKCKEKKLFYVKYMIYKIKEFLIKNWQKIIIKYLLIILIYYIILYFNNSFLDFSLIDKINNLSLIKRFLLPIVIIFIPDFISYDVLANIDKMFEKIFKKQNCEKLTEFSNEIKNLISYAFKYLGNNKRRIIICIENLDRCSAANIKEILDSICKFFELCKQNNTELFTLFAVDKNIIIQALKDNKINPKKAENYLEKIINLPVELEYPPNIDTLINRLLGEGNNKYKSIVKKIYEDSKFPSRRLANLRYLIAFKTGIGQELSFEEIYKVLLINTKLIP